MVGDTQLNTADKYSNGDPIPLATGGNTDEEANALRWREAILNLSKNLMNAAADRSELAPYLMEAMHSALDNLLVNGREDDLLALEEWLEHEAAAHR